jgi:hypothetical protein
MGNQYPQSFAISLQQRIQIVQSNILIKAQGFVQYNNIRIYTVHCTIFEAWLFSYYISWHSNSILGCILDGIAQLGDHSVILVINGLQNEFPIWHSIFCVFGRCYLCTLPSFMKNFSSVSTSFSHEYCPTYATLCLLCKSDANCISYSMIDCLIHESDTITADMFSIIM